MARQATTTVHAVTLAASLLAHAAAAVVARGSHAPPSRTARPQFELPVELVQAPLAEDEVQPPEERPAVTAQVRAAAPPTHTHSYPVAPDHDAHPHSPEFVHLPAVKDAAKVPDNSVLPVVDAAASEPVRFTLPSVGRPTSLGTSVAVPSLSSAERPSGSTETLSESAVSVPAHLLSSATVTYPPAAREAEIEADVPVEIVVDEQGRVVEACGTRRSGYGLDEAAARSVRAYRFAPAVKDGRRVRVRMRWVVQFRLR